MEILQKFSKQLDITDSRSKYFFSERRVSCQFFKKFLESHFFVSFHSLLLHKVKSGLFEFFATQKISENFEAFYKPWYSSSLNHGFYLEFMHEKISEN